MCLILFPGSKKKTPPLIISSPVSPNLARVRKSASKKRIPLFSSSPPILPFPCLVSRGCTTRECSARVGTLSTRAKEEEDRTSPEDPPLSSSSPAPPSPLSPPSLPRCVSTALALPSHPSLRPTPFPSLPLIRMRQTCLFLRLAMGCRDPTRGRERERERRRLQPASNGAEVACTPSPPKIPIPLVSPPHEERRGFFLSRPKTGDRLLARPRLGGKLYALDPTPFPIFLSRSRCDRVNRPARHLCTIIEDRIAVATSCFLSHTRRIQRYRVYIPRDLILAFSFLSKLFSFFARRFTVAKHYLNVESRGFSVLLVPRNYNSVVKTKQTESDRFAQMRN